MTTSIEQRQRLSRFVDLARVYRGWTRSELSTALGRDPSKLIPESGNPKLDLLVGIADALDWTVGDVAESVWKGDASTDEQYRSLSFPELNEESLKAHRSGAWGDMLKIAKVMASQASTSDEYALACNRIGGAFDGMGRYANALKSWQDGLSQQGVSERFRLMLQANLANSHYTLWHLVEAKAIASDLVAKLDAKPTTDRLERVVAANARYVRGNAQRRMINEEPDSVDSLCQAAINDLQSSQEIYLNLAEEFGDDSYNGVANTCTGALTEVQAAHGLIAPIDAIRKIEAGLEQVVDPSAIQPGDQLESWGWWAIFGCNVSLRHLNGETMHRQMAVFTNKAIEIAERLGNWSMRERAFTLEHFRRQQAGLEEVQEQSWPLDDDDIRVITGTMGRFPSFREVGWQILRGARVLDAE